MVSTSSTNDAASSTNDLNALLSRAQEISSDAEVVTRAHLRKVTLAARNGQPAGVMGLITLDNGEDTCQEQTLRCAVQAPVPRFQPRQERCHRLQIGLKDVRCRCQGRALRAWWHNSQVRSDLESRSRS